MKTPERMIIVVMGFDQAPSPLNMKNGPNKAFPELKQQQQQQQRLPRTICFCNILAECQCLQGESGQASTQSVQKTVNNLLHERKRVVDDDLEG
jgi:hypothetical protein